MQRIAVERIPPVDHAGDVIPICQYVLEVAGVDSEVERRVRSVLNQHFRPEFLNRVDEIVIFHSLTMDHLTDIVDIQLWVQNTMQQT